MKTPPRPDERGGGGAGWTKNGLSQPALSPQGSQQLLRKLEAALQRLDRRTEALGIIATWRDELCERLAKAELRFELVGLPDEEQVALVAEVRDFKRLCRALGWTGRRRS